MHDRGRRGSQSGLTFIELLVVVIVLMVLAAAAIPMTRWNDKRKKEQELRITLRSVREAIDNYKKYADEGMIIQEDVEQMGYPPDLETMVDGVDIGDPSTVEAKKVKFLQRLPVDPFTGETEWGQRSYQDDFDSDSWGGENLYDIYSLSDLTALDGTYYKDW